MQFRGILVRHALLTLLAVGRVSCLASVNQEKWAPTVSSLEERRQLRGSKQESETIGSIGFHHVEFYCGDARMAANQFACALGMSVTGTTGQSTGNDKCVSYGLASGNFHLLLTAPYSREVVANGVAVDEEKNIQYDAPLPMPNFDVAQAHNFFQKHGLAARAVALHVKDAETAFEVSVRNGATPVLEPTFLSTCPGQEKQGVKTTGCYIAEVQLYGDVVLRYVSYPPKDGSVPGDESVQASVTQPNMPFLPHLAPAGDLAPKTESYGIFKIDHAVGNVPNLLETYERIKTFTGFHEFAEFTSEDVGTVDSGLNSVVLASDSEEVLLPINEPMFGKRKSQIQTYLEQNEGAGLQHLALKTRDIFSTVEKMRETQTRIFGFELMKRPSQEYYEELPSRIGDKLTVSCILLYTMVLLLVCLA
jgi:4-hydroxyphenylpyruvate dioxygenase